MIEVYNNSSIYQVILAIAVLFPLFIFLSTALINSMFGPYLYSKVKPINDLPFVSVLIPARNEENNISRVIQSILSQNYSNLELIVLDDNSTDRTYEIASKYSAEHDNIRIISGKNLPKNWLGKNWACHQLSKEAKGEYLIFTDSDNFHDENAVLFTIYHMFDKDLDLLSAFPNQQTVTFSEKLIVPMIDLIIYSGLILWTTYFIKHAEFAAANGQWIAFRSDVYFELGGHESVKSEIVEDVSLSRFFKRRGKKILTFSGKNIVFGRMYSNFSDIWHGLSKNVFGLANFKTIPFFVLLFTFFLTSVAPYILVWFNDFSIIGYIAIAMIILWKLILAINHKQNIIISIFFHPFSVLIFIFIGLNSFFQSKFGKVKWKDREIQLQK